MVVSPGLRSVSVSGGNAQEGGIRTTNSREAKEMRHHQVDQDCIDIYCKFAEE